MLYHQELLMMIYQLTNNLIRFSFSLLKAENWNPPDLPWLCQPVISTIYFYYRWHFPLFSGPEVLSYTLGGSAPQEDQWGRIARGKGRKQSWQALATGSLRQIPFKIHTPCPHIRETNALVDYRTAMKSPWMKITKRKAFLFHTVFFSILQGGKSSAFGKKHNRRFQTSA